MSVFYWSTLKWKFQISRTFLGGKFEVSSDFVILFCSFGTLYSFLSHLLWAWQGFLPPSSISRLPQRRCFHWDCLFYSCTLSDTFPLIPHRLCSYLPSFRLVLGIFITQAGFFRPQFCFTFPPGVSIFSTVRSRLQSGFWV